MNYEVLSVCPCDSRNSDVLSDQIQVLQKM